MIVLKLDPVAPSLEEVLRDVETDEVVLTRNGKPLARIEKVTDDDWQDLTYESSPEALERGRRGREQYAAGKFTSLEDVKKQHGLV